MPAASEPIAVNTGPLIALSACGCLDLLSRLHSRVVAPEAVLAEFLRGQPTEPGDLFVQPAWLEVCALATLPSPLLVKKLDRGEAETITLAIEQSIQLVVIDERRGRTAARLSGLRVTGSIGILLRAKREGLIAAIKPCLHSMQHAGMWQSQRLRSQALREAGED
jgi:predicted nucleic acid-binding protein